MKFQPFACPTEIHVLPESVEVQMPCKATAVSFVPSSEEVMDFQYFVDPIEVTSIHELPESIEVQILPLETTAASFVPSAEEVMDIT